MKFVITLTAVKYQQDKIDYSKQGGEFSKLPNFNRIEHYRKVLREQVKSGI